MIPEETNIISDIPTQTFEKFLEQLKTEGISTDVIEKLRKAILEERTPTEAAIRAALFADDQNP